MNEIDVKYSTEVCGWTLYKKRDGGIEHICDKGIGVGDGKQ